MKFNNHQKGILIVSFWFPPSTMVGGKRFAFLSRILHKSYPELHILTLKEKYISPKDNTLTYSGITHRAGMLVTRPVPSINLFKRIWRRLWEDYLCLFDPYSGWILPALIKGLRVIRANKISVIIATGPPFSPMVVGYLLSKITKASLILDYRDPWSNHNWKEHSLFRKKSNQFVEKLAVRQASAIVFCSRIMLENFKNSIGKNTTATCSVIPNGFHVRDNIQSLSLGNSRKNMVYAGNFYGERRLSLLVKPLLKLLDENSISEKSFRFHIFGKILDDDKEMIRKFGLREIIEEHPRVSYEQVIRYLKDADILFLPSGSDVKYAIPYKFYDYLSVKRPILAVAPENSAMAELMKQIDCGRLALINSEESIITNLRKMLFENRQYGYSGTQKYNWEEIGRRYVDVIEKLQ